MICDAHCHLFSPTFFAALGRELRLPEDRAADEVAGRLGWEPDATVEALADRWVRELDRHGVARAALIASVPGDEASAAIAAARHPDRLVGFFMFNPLVHEASARLQAAGAERGLRCVCLFPAMHRYSLDSPRAAAVFEAAARHGWAVFVHCGVLSVGARKKLGLPSLFDVRAGDPLAVARAALEWPSVPFILPHFGAGMLREALMAADLAPNVHLDTSSSNAWIKYHPGLSLEQVFRQTIGVAGAARLLFGTDSSFFPRGWQRGIYDEQAKILDAIGLGEAERALVLGGNFLRLFARLER
jgi:predicted TIM-barrel fold metal-dependent hydrolase